MRYVIVSRHPAAIAFIRAHAAPFRDAPVVANATVGDVADAHVAGNLPLDLAAKAASVTAVLFRGQPPRGQEYDLAAMEAAGAYVATFVVAEAPLPRTEAVKIDL